jgi:hypothetical protein
VKQASEDFQVSVVSPVYNAGPLTERAAKRVLEQPEVHEVTHLGRNVRERVDGQFRWDLHIADVEQFLQESIALHGIKGCHAKLQLNMSQS